MGYSRFGHATLPVHHDVAAVERLLHVLATPLKWLWWRIVELMFRFQFGLSGDFVPSSRIEHDLFSGGQILSYEFRDMLRDGQVMAQKGGIARFTPSGVELADGSQVRDLCFIGAETSTFNNILTQGLQALWLRRVLSGEVQLPTPDTMEAAVARDKAWKHSWMPKKGDRAAILQLHKMKYHDQLCKDMGVNHKRKGWNLLAEVFAPYSAADYTGLFADKREGSGAMLVLIMTVLLAIVFFVGTGSLKIAAI